MSILITVAREEKSYNLISKILEKRFYAFRKSEAKLKKNFSTPYMISELKFFCQFFTAFQMIPHGAEASPRKKLEGI